MALSSSEGTEVSAKNHDYRGNAETVNERRGTPNQNAGGAGGGPIDEWTENPPQGVVGEME